MFRITMLYLSDSSSPLQQYLLLFIPHYSKIFSTLGMDCLISQSSCLFCEISGFFQDGFEEACFMPWWPSSLNIFHGFSKFYLIHYFRRFTSLKKKPAEENEISLQLRSETLTLSWKYLIRNYRSLQSLL